MCALSKREYAKTEESIADSLKKLYSWIFVE